LRTKRSIPFAVHKSLGGSEGAFKGVLDHQSGLSEAELSDFGANGRVRRMQEKAIVPK
jgi:hypothetical protein